MVAEQHSIVTGRLLRDGIAAGSPRPDPRGLGRHLPEGVRTRWLAGNPVLSGSPEAVHLDYFYRNTCLTDGQHQGARSAPPASAVRAASRGGLSPRASVGRTSAHTAIEIVFPAAAPPVVVLTFQNVVAVREAPTA